MDWPQVIEQEVPAQPAGIWTLIVEYVRGPALVKVEAEDTKWYYSQANSCTADGDLLSLISTQSCILKGAPVGALIGKIGGSTAGVADGTVFLAGKTCIIELDQSKRGPLYLTINDEVTGMGNNSGELKVRVSIKPNPESSGVAGNA
jgi:hypothetical protein